MIDQNLNTADLAVDESYGGSRNGNASDDPLPQLLGVDNGAGFRHLGKRPAVKTLKLLALKSSLQTLIGQIPLPGRAAYLSTMVISVSPASYTTHLF